MKKILFVLSVMFLISCNTELVDLSNFEIDPSTQYVINGDPNTKYIGAIFNGQQSYYVERDNVETIALLSEAINKQIKVIVYYDGKIVTGVTLK